MEQKKAKEGMGASFIIGIVFTLIGVTFLPLGIILHQTEVDSSERVIFLYTFGGIGILFLIIGVIFLILMLQKKKEAQQLLDNGRYILAEICEIVPNYTVRVNGKNPYIIKCKYEAINGTVHIFKSRNLFFNPESVLKGTRVKVYTDRINYKKYYVDIDEVLPNIKIH